MQTTVEFEFCCEDTKYDLNPRKHYPKVRKKRLAFFDWVNSRNPFEEQISDSADVQKVFSEYPFVPFSGDSMNSGHTLLKFFVNIAKLSPTHGSCINKLIFFLFGGKVKVVQGVDDVFDFGEKEQDASIDLAKRFGEEIRKINLSSLNIKDFAKYQARSYKATGNSYFVLTLSESLGEKGSSIISYKPEHCVCIDLKASVKYIAISKKFEYNYLQQNPPEILPVYPYFATLPNGTKKTIFHIKNGEEWYGMPDSLQSSTYQFREFQDVFYLINQSDRGFVGQALIEVEGDDPENNAAVDDEKDDNPDMGYENTAERVEQNFTNKGEDPMSVMYMERPFGSRPAFVHEFKPNQNENFFHIEGEDSRLKIIESHYLTERLLGESQAAGLNSSGVFMEEFKLIMPMINEYQTFFEFYINTAIQEIMKFKGLTEFTNLRLRFQSPYQIIEEEKKDGGGTDDRGGNSSERAGQV